MYDLIAVLVLSVLFAVAAGYVSGCERLKVKPKHD